MEEAEEDCSEDEGEDAREGFCPGIVGHVDGEVGDGERDEDCVSGLWLRGVSRASKMNGI